MNEQNYPATPILIVDDEEQALFSNEITLRSGGFNNVLKCQDSRKVVSLLDAHDINLVLLDLSMPHLTGEELLPMLSETHPETMVIVVTGANEVESAVNSMRSGAFDYLVKPVSKERLITSVQRAVEMIELREEVNMLRTRMVSGGIENKDDFAEIITDDARMHSIFQYIETVAATSRSVLVTGETGVGKEMIARSIHNISGRKGNFVAVNVAGLDDNIFSDTLFGHTKGAYTGASEHRDGLIEHARGGTLVLDEIGDLASASQVKLLRLLQEGEYYQLGSDSIKYADVRIVATTNQEIDQLRQNGQFRNDLFYRLKTHHVHIPPLRSRTNDIPLLIRHFVNEAANEMQVRTPDIPNEINILLANYSFPGNVRELKAMIYDAVSRSRGRRLSTELFREHIGAGFEIPVAADRSDDSEIFRITADQKLPTIEDVTDFLVEEALRRSDGNQTIAAQILGISQPTLSRRIRKKKG